MPTAFYTGQHLPTTYIRISQRRRNRSVFYFTKLNAIVHIIRRCIFLLFFQIDDQMWVGSRTAITLALRTRKTM